MHARSLAGEKALKAALILLDVDPPRTHNLQLLADLLPADWGLEAIPADLARLSMWIVESRYPGDWPDASDGDAEVAASDAAAVLDAVAADIERRRES
jgi:HEPN domain-containing protein